MRGIPRIADGVVVTPVATADGLAYRLRSPRRGAGTVVAPRTAVPLLLMDGKRNLAEVHRASLAHGIKITEPSRFLAMLSVLEAAGVIDVDHHFESPGPLRHGCEGCGQSCQGHLVGPIDPAEAALLEERLAELRATDGSVAEGPAVITVRHDGEDHPVLNSVNGACIFLDGDNRCRLHARWGATSKPLPCRMFPFRMVGTETGTRIAISPRCFRAHHSYESAPPITADALLAEWGVWRPPSTVQGLDPTRDDVLSPTPASELNRAHEAALLAMLDEPDPPDLAAMLASLRVSSGDPPSRPNPGRTERLRFGRSVLATQKYLFGTHFSFDAMPGKTRYGESLTALGLGIVALDETRAPDWWDLPEPAARYVRHCLRHFVFSRDVMGFGSVRAGVLALAMGSMAARWLADRRDLEASRIDAFVQHQTAWLRLSASPELRAIMLPEPDGADALLGLLWASWS